ncbi:unnamed protein product, partial [Oppiella nova]
MRLSSAATTDTCRQTHDYYDMTLTATRHVPPMPCPHFGNLPKDYNKAVHGNYYPFRYYGKPDTPLADVKMSELTSWLNRRNVHPVAIFQAVMRSFYRFEQRFVQPRYAYIGRAWNMK